MSRSSRERGAATEEASAHCGRGHTLSFLIWITRCAKAQTARLNLAGLRVADRVDTYQAAAFLRHLDRLRTWEQQACGFERDGDTVTRKQQHGFLRHLDRLPHGVIPLRPLAFGKWNGAWRAFRAQGPGPSSFKKSRGEVAKRRHPVSLN
jgi:hypothetical protein